MVCRGRSCSTHDRGHPSRAELLRECLGGHGPERVEEFVERFVVAEEDVVVMVLRHCPRVLLELQC
jgi:hypothetical protein